MRTHRRIRMRILFLALDINLDRQRGDTVHAMELANGLASIGHAITFVVGAASGHSPTLRSDMVLRVVGGSNRRVVRETLAVARRSAIDIVYERRSTPKIGFAVKTRRRIPLVMEINGGPADREAGGVPAARARIREAASGVRRQPSRMAGLRESPPSDSSSP